jgi:hypothetical protein
MGSMLCAHAESEKFYVRGPCRQTTIPTEYVYFQCPQCKAQWYRKREPFDGGGWLSWCPDNEEEEQTIQKPVFFFLNKCK